MWYQYVIDQAVRCLSVAMAQVLISIENSFLLRDLLYVPKIEDFWLLVTMLQPVLPDFI